MVTKKKKTRQPGNSYAGHCLALCITSALHLVKKLINFCNWQLFFLCLPALSIVRALLMIKIGE